MERPVIFILIDQLINIESLPCSIKKDLKGYEKWSKRCINFQKNYITNIPCSPSRATVYTGKNCTETKVSDNTNNSWQASMPDVNTLPTMGTYLKRKGYKTRYIGKVHWTKTLDRNVILKSKPTIACQNFLQPYDFDIFNKKGDNGFNINGGFFNDLDVIEQDLPNGNDPDKCDFYDNKNHKAYDGAIPYLKSNKNNNKFLCVINIQNPHDITYSNVINGPYSRTATLQLSGDPNFPNTNAEFNKNYRMFYDQSLLNKKSLIEDNVNESLTNITPLYIARLYYLASDWYSYGITQDNLLSYKYYQTSYLQMVKQIDTQLEQLYDFLEKESYFEKAVIVLTSDHGEYNGAHGMIGKGSIIYEQAWNTILLISYPHMKEEYKGKKYSHVTSHIQLVPTIMLLSNNYKESEIDNLALFPPIFKKSKCGYELKCEDFRNVKLGLSVGYGAILLPLLRSLQIFEINKNLIEKIPIEYNYFTIPGFSVSANIRYKNQLYNCGYYFSIEHLFIENLQKFKFVTTIVNSDFIQNLNTTVILYNSLEESGIAIVGTLQQISQQLWSDAFGTELYFKQYKIIPFDPLNPENKYIDTGVITIYGTKIYSNSPIFNSGNVASILQPVLPALPSGISTLYDAGQPLNGKYVFVGLTDYINNMRDTDPLINTWISPTIVSGLLPAFNIYVCNDPIYQKARVYAQNSVDIPAIITALSFLPDIDNLYDGDILKVISALKFNLDYDIFNSMSFFMLLYLQSLVIYKLPGLGLSARKLIKAGFQVQVFNNTEDPAEIYNLADESRLHENRKLCKKLLKILEEHVDYQNLKYIFLTLPSDINVKTFYEDIRNFILSDMPRIYNYSLLESNAYNVTNGGS